MFRPERIEPKPGQESVWDYPRPPRLELSPKRIQIVFNGVTIADSQQTQRVLETSHPPVYYIPPEDIKMEYLNATSKQSFCEWKGVANYYTIVLGDKQETNVAWYYSNPTPAFAPMKNYVAFYPSRMEACYVNGEVVQSQPGDFYGGWITNDIVGPFKGGTGSWGW
ncbi:MAG: DUF427 domain-containing protein [Gomphosphaeria aponina SAG 52.96 = DSM 107014]|uniref:DUF427 domain-containing protein n=1 Tax=Gomphosphaeria aponina SAG 52.96 = DSM 107014 TaxID=1521640 RepID=A0A941GSF9_9CHRO|nr:DUF427 domain-containing protein [Gomphosphaeria aponina SAG 52.96 = DSM 107014]